MAKQIEPNNQLSAQHPDSMHWRVYDQGGRTYEGVVSIDTVAKTALVSVFNQDGQALVEQLPSGEKRVALAEISAVGMKVVHMLTGEVLYAG